MQIEFNGEVRNAPDFLIVGAPRCGTSALYTYFSRHPQIFMPSRKEPMFFSCWRREPFADYRDPPHPIDWTVSDPGVYLELFDQARPGQIIGEASTWYLIDFKHAIPNIHRFYSDLDKDLKIIVMLRNPAERAWSQHQMQVSERREDLNFKRALDPDVIASRRERNFSLTYDYVGTGRYYAQVKAYLEYFPKVKVFVFEEFFADPRKNLSLLYDFLGVENHIPAGGPVAYNVSGRPKGLVANAALNLVYTPNRLKSVIKHFLPLRLRTQLKYRIKKQCLERQSIPDDIRREILQNVRSDVHSLEDLLGRSLSLWYPETQRGDAL